MPHGLPKNDYAQSLCMQHVVWAGGDVARLVDRPAGDVDRFVRYVERIRGVCEGRTRPLIVLTKTNPLALTVVETRRRIEQRFPGLREARWVISLDLVEDPFFESMAEKLGHLTGPLARAPHWIGPNDERFIVLTDLATSRALVDESLDLYDELLLAQSGVMRVQGN